MVRLRKYVELSTSQIIAILVCGTDSDLSSGSENGEDQSRSHHANRRKVVGGSHREVFASKKRELHKSKRPKSSKPVRDSKIEYVLKCV